MRPKVLWLVAFLLPCFGQAEELKLDPLVQKEIKVVTKQGKQVFLVSLKGVLRIALDRAPELVRWSKQVEAAQAGFRASQSAEPLSLTTGFNQNLSVSPYTFSSVPGTYLSVGATRSNQVSSELSQKTKWGLKYGLVYQKSISQTQLGSIATKGAKATGFSGITEPIYSDSLKVDVNVPLLRGLGEVNRDNENRLAVGLKQTQLQAKNSRDRLLGQVASVYWDLVAVHQNLRSLEQSLELSEQFYQESLTRMRLGAMERSEVKLAELQVGAVKKEQLGQQIARKLIEDQIRLILGLSKFDVAYEPTETLAVKKITESPKGLIKKALAGASDLAMVRQRLELNHLDRIKAEDKDSSTLDLSLQWQLNGFGYDGSTATSGLSDSGTQGYLVGLKWKVPLYDPRPGAKRRQVDLEAATLESEYSEVKDQVKLQVRSYLRQLQLAEMNIKLAKNQVQLNRELLTKEEEKLRLGKSTGYRQSQVQQDLTDAQLGLTMAQISFEKTYVSLMLLTNQFEASYGL